MPRGGKGTSLRLAITHHAANEEVRVVECGAVRVGQRIAELATLADRSWCLGRGVTRNAPWKRELPKQPTHPFLVLPYVGVELAIGALEVGVGHDTGTTMARASDIDRIQIPGPDDAVHMRVQEVQTWSSSPVTQQP